MASKKEKNQVNQSKAAARREHFADGGSPSKWMGKGARHQDRKKHQNKEACRRKVSW